MGLSAWKGLFQLLAISSEVLALFDAKTSLQTGSPQLKLMATESQREEGREGRREEEGKGE